MDYKDMAESLGYGEEYKFFYKEKEYWISKNKEGNYLTEVSSEATQEFRSSNELLTNAKINGKSIFEIWNDIKEQF